MYLSTTIVLGYIATLGTALFLPANPEDGVFKAEIGDSGLENIVRVSDLIAGDDQASLNIVIRAGMSRATNQFNTYCGCGYNVPPKNCDNAVESLEKALDAVSTIESQYTYFAVANNVVAFACNTFPRSYDTSGEIFRNAATSISESCGSYVAGSYGDQGRFVMGYMQHTPDLRFCYNAATSPSSSC